LQSAAAEIGLAGDRQEDDAVAVADGTV